MPSNPFKPLSEDLCSLCQRPLPLLWEGPTCRWCAARISAQLGRNAPSRTTSRGFETSSRWPTKEGLGAALATVLAVIAAALLVYMVAPRW